MEKTSENTPHKIIINSEDDAWSLFEEITQDGSILPAHIEVEFNEWPKLEVKLTGEIFDGTLPTSVMSGIVELQNNLYRSYAEAKYNKYDIRSLSPEDRAAMELNVRVKSGSTDLSTILSEAFVNLTKELITKMSPEQVMTIVIALALMYFGRSAFVHWLEKRKNDKALDLQRFAQEQETQRLALMAEVAKGNQRISDIVEDANNGINALLKSMARADSVGIHGENLDNETVKKLVARPRKTASDIRLDGDFMVSNVDASDIEGHKVRLFHRESGRYLIVLIQPGDIDLASRKKIQDAIWNKEPLYMSINAKELRGEITNASIIAVGKEEA